MHSGYSNPVSTILHVFPRLEHLYSLHGLLISLLHSSQLAPPGGASQGRHWNSTDFSRYLKLKRKVPIPIINAAIANTIPAGFQAFPIAPINKATAKPAIPPATIIQVTAEPLKPKDFAIKFPTTAPIAMLAVAVINVPIVTGKPTIAGGPIKSAGNV